MSRRIVPLALAAAGLLVVPLAVTATTASWNDAEWVHDSEIGTSSLLCGTDTGFATASYGRFLSGELLGTDLDPIADLEQMTLALDGGGVDISPADPLDLGSVPPDEYVYANPFDLSVLDIIGVDLTGFSVGLPGAALGAANQYTRVDSFGTAAGASGLVNNSGAVLVSETTPPADLPAPATIDIGDLLPAITGIADAELELGAVASSSVLDGCAALRQEVWGIPPTAPVSVRDYGIAGLDLELDAPVLDALVTAVNNGLDDITDALDALLGTNGLISQTLSTNLNLVVPGVVSAAMTGDVTLTGLDLDQAVSSLLTTPLTGNGFVIDLQAGTVTVDIAALTAGLNNAPPNTQLVLNATVMNGILLEAGALLDAWVLDVVAAIDGAIRDAELHIHLDTSISAIALNLANVSIDVDASIGAIMSNSASITVVPTVAGGLSGTINTLLAIAGLPTLTSILTSLTNAGGALTTAVANLLTTQVFSIVSTLGTTLAGLVAPVITALGLVFDALPTVVSLMVNVQPDQAGAPPSPTALPPIGDATGEYVVAALRLGLADFALPGDVASVTFATSSAGPVTAP